MSRPAEFIEREGDVWSWYCAECLRELGADLDAPTRDGMPREGCPEHGLEAIAWELWNGEIDPHTNRLVE